MAVRILHFADAHIDMTNYGKRNTSTGLPYRVEDFLRALDTIVDTAVTEKVDLVIFAGDAYKDRTPVPTFQREWGKRIMRLSQAKIPTILLVGNHDFSPSQGRAHTLQEFETLEIPYIRVISYPVLLGPEDLWGVPVQVLGLPWVSKAKVLAAKKNKGFEVEDINETIETTIGRVVDDFLGKASKEFPIIFTAHASVQGAKYGKERSVMLGKDLVISKSLVCDPRIDYSALGHIHKPQNLNIGAHPPVIYPGSIERVDFGEIDDQKFFIIAEVGKGKTEVEWRELIGRTFIDRSVKLNEDDVNVTQLLINALPEPEVMKDAIVRLVIHYPEGMETRIDYVALMNYASSCFDFRLVKRPQFLTRLRLSSDQQFSSLPPFELLDLYFKVKHFSKEESAELMEMAEVLLNEEEIVEDG
ncbi:MAG: exonuclease SbcCD subunit D [Anaerolineaceae bacterium]|nr:exonuclease SbcCD subunit D [Anaerolineaceae bacterium]